MLPRPPQTESTHALALRAIAAGDTREGVRRIRQLVDDAAEGRELFPLFIDRARRFLLARGVAPATVAGEEQRILSLLGATADDALDMPRQWAGVQELATRAELACLAGNRPAASGDMDPTRDEYAVVPRPWAESVELLLADAALSLRGHLSGPGRTGEVSLHEEEDRWVFRFEPCGSGGRTLRDDANADGAARVGPPFGFRVTTQEHDWAWRTKGVCLYCAHCCQLQSRAAIPRLGYPVRVVDPPVWGTAEPREYCTWSVYKDPQLVPDEAYRRGGGKKARGGRGGHRE